VLLQKAPAALAVILSLYGIGCGGGGEEPPPGPTDSGSEVAGDAITDDALADAGDDAAVDAAPTVKPHNGMDIVSGGNVMKSPGFTMISTLGQSSQHQGATTSTNFKLRGGLVGVTGSSK
jgi:hypothetical protein